MEGGKRTIRLRGMSGPVKGRLWASAGVLRVGRLETLDVVLDDNSVSRFHAEVHPTERGWRVRDLGSTNGTRLNGARLGSGQWPVRARDLLQFGEVAVLVEALEEPAAGGDEVANADGGKVVVEAAAKLTWDDALAGLAFDGNRHPRAGETLLALLRAGHHVSHLDKEEDLLQQILRDAVGVLDAQRGAIVLAEGPAPTLRLRALVTGADNPRARLAGRDGAGGRCHYSHSLASRCFTRGESILCQHIDDDPELAVAQSITEGAMASALCVLLRTPRRPLGVLHLDRSPWQTPFTAEDLRLADALAANVSAGIESAQLLRKQRELFMETITVLAQAVELRDETTGNHIHRVKTYALLLAEHLGMSAEDVERIRVGAPLHDIGKIGIDDAILKKPGKLTDAEFEVMKRHTVLGAAILQAIPDFRPILPIVRSHHERWDGRGYPDGLAGEAIHPLARVVALADCFDAMTTDRPYRRGMSAHAAFAEIEKGVGVQFDPVMAQGFLRVRDAVTQAMRAAAAGSKQGTRQVQVLAARA